jgi:hypothetical protein
VEVVVYSAFVGRQRSTCDINEQTVARMSEGLAGDVFGAGQGSFATSSVNLSVIVLGAFFFFHSSLIVVLTSSL